MKNKNSEHKKSAASDAKKISRVIMLIGLCMIIFGIAGYYYGRYEYNDKKASCTAVTPGSVTNCVEQVVTHTRRHAGSHKEFFCHVCFSYTIGDKEYTGRQRLTYNPGQTVDVHYDPDTPGKSYIEASPEDTYKTDTTVSILGVWVIFIGFLLPLRINTPGIRQNRK